MSTMQKLNLTAASKAAPRNDTQLRRHKLISRLRQQKQVAQAHIAGNEHTQRRKVISHNADTGERTVTWQERTVRAWYWFTESGVIHFPVKYGSKALELAKGKNAIVVRELSELPDAIDLLIEATNNGELDKHIDALLAQRRK